jgi:hypothetical protein
MMINQKKIILTGIVLLFAFITTIGATFAWFTIGNVNTVESINLTISAEGSILILVDDGYPNVDFSEVDLTVASNYQTILTNASILSVYRFDYIKLEPVTTLNGSSFTFRDPLIPANADDDQAGSGANAGQYIEFSVWLLSQAIDVEIIMSELSLSASNSNPLQDTVINTLRLSTTSDAGTFIFGIDKDYDFEYWPDIIGYDPLGDNALDPSDIATITALHGLYFTAGTNVSDSSTLDSDEPDPIVSLLAGVPKKVTIRIWIEGWDLQSNNNLLNAIFNLAFQFKVKGSV